MSIGKNIRTLRKANNLTQDELASKIGISGKTISSWEIDRTEPDMGMIEKLSKYFGCEKSELIGDVEQDYYISEDVRQLAQQIFDNKDLRMLLDASRNVSTEDLKLIYDMIKRMKNN